MGHAHHFLQRLDRVELPHVELALRLYQDHHLLRYVLASVGVPEGAERVALSLEHPREGPFLILTREGRFVTCLARGMGVGDLPIIPREKLDSVAAHVEKLRENLEKARSFVGPDCESGRMLRWIYTTGSAMSREQFEAIAAFQPMMERELAWLYFDAVVMLLDARRQALRITRAKPANRKLLESYWKTLWAVGHLACLAAMGSAREQLAAMRGPEGHRTLFGMWSWGATRQGLLPMAARGLWGTAKLGKLCLGPYKRAVPDACTLALTVDRVLGLSAIGLRHKKLLAEVDKALQLRTREGDDAMTQYRRGLDGVGEALRKAALDAPEEALAWHLRMGRGLCADLCGRLGGLNGVEGPEDVPEDVARALPVNVMFPILQLDSPSAHILPILLPWVARAEASQLYLPREWLALVPRWTPAESLHTLRVLREYDGVDTPVQTPPRPGRNAPCPCGSGQKHKRCCAK